MAPQERLLLVGSFTFASRAVERRRDLLEDRLGRLRVLLRPQRMVVAHRLAPVRHRERGIDLLRALERHRGFVELEAVQALHAFEERRLRRRRAGGREGDGAELLRMNRAR